MLVGSAFGKVALDTSGMTAGVQSAQKSMQTLKDAGDKLGKGLQDAGNALTVGLTLPLVAFGAASVKAAMDSESALAELNAVLKSTGKAAGVSAEQVVDFAQAMQKVTKFDDDAIIGGQSMLLTFTKIGKEVFPQASKAMLNMAEKFGSIDQAAMQLGKALNDPIAGVGALRRVGVSLSAQQEKQIQDFMAVNDIASAQKIILQELEVEFGGLAEAAGGTNAGKMAQFTNAIGDLQEVVGTALLPHLIKLTETVRSVADWFMALPPATQEAIINFGIFLAVLGPILSTLGNAIFFFNSVGTAMGTLGITGASTSAFISGTLLPALAGIAPVLLAILPAVALLYWAFSTNFMGIRTTAEQMTVVLPYLFSQWVESVKTATYQLGYIVGYALKQWPAMVEAAILAVVAKAQSMAGHWIETGQNMVLGIVKGLEDGWQWLVNTVYALAQSAYEAAKSALGISSPSKMFMSLGMYSAIGYGNGFQSGMKQTNAQIKKQIKDLLAQISQKATVRSDGVITWKGFIDKETLDKINQAQMLMAKLGEQGGNLGQQAQQLGMNMQGASAAVDQLKNSAMATFQQTDWSILGKYITDGLVMGLYNGQNAVVAAAQAVAKAAFEAAKAELGISSPSKKFAFLGEMSGMGYMMGMANAIDPGEIAKSMMRPVTQVANSSVQSQTTYQNFASGLTIRQAQSLVGQTIDQRERKELRRQR